MWFECAKVKTAHDKAEAPQNVHQVGGTAVIMEDGLVSKKCQDKDSRSNHIGHWTWTTLHGKHDTK